MEEKKINIAKITNIFGDCIFKFLILEDTRS